MSPDQIAVIQDCASRTTQGTITFGEVVGKLIDIGVERYHADFSRHEGTFYMPNGQSLVVWMKYPTQDVAKTFSEKGIAEAIGKIQRGEIIYTDFVALTQAAGCVGYFVQIVGKRVLYFGRNGEVHVEPFPMPPK